MKLQWQEHRYREHGASYSVFVARLADGSWDAEVVFPNGNFTAGHHGKAFATEDDACGWARCLAARHLGETPVQQSFGSVP